MTNFLKIKFRYTQEGLHEEWIESLWATPVGANYRLENIPFYVKEFALGDIVSSRIVNGEPFVDDLVEESGNSTIHIVFYNENIVNKTRTELKELGCSSELSDRPHLIALNVPREIDYRKVIFPFLDKGFGKKLWDFQEACLSSLHSI